MPKIGSKNLEIDVETTLTYDNISLTLVRWNDLSGPIRGPQELIPA